MLIYITGIKLPGAKVRNGAPRSIAKGRRVMTNKATGNFSVGY